MRLLRFFAVFLSLLPCLSAGARSHASRSDSTPSRLRLVAALRICPGKNRADHLGVSHPLYRSDTRVSLGFQTGLSLALHPHFRVFAGLGFFHSRSHELFPSQLRGRIQIGGELWPIFSPALSREYRQNYLESPLRLEYLPGGKNKGFVLALANTSSFWIWGRYKESMDRNYPGFYPRNRVRMDFQANARFVFSQELQVGYILPLAHGRELDGRILASYDGIRFPSHPTRRVFLGLQLGLTWQTQKKAK